MSAPTRSRGDEWRDAMHVDWPVSSHGSASLRRFEVTEHDAAMERMRSAFSGGRGCARPGVYTGLHINGALWMSDTPDEQRDHMKFLWRIRENHSRALVNGLGLGMVVRAL